MAHLTAHLTTPVTSADDQSQVGQDPIRPDHAKWWTATPALDRNLPSRWRQWIDGPDGRRTLEQWAVHAELRACTADDLADPVQQCGFEKGNQIQTRLSKMAQAGSSRATATVLVQLRPGLTRLAHASTAWAWRPANDLSEARSDVQATFLEVLYAMDLDRRGRRIAANLVNDTRQRLWRSSPAGWTSECGGTTNYPTLDASDPVINQLFSPHLTGADESRADTILDLAQSLKQASSRAGDTAEMVYLVWIEEHPIAEVAELLGLPAGAVANRLHRLRKRLRVSHDSSGRIAS